MQTTERYILADLEKWRETTRDIEPPIRLGVLGDPVAHSLSPQMQNAALRACEIDMQYARFHIRASELRSALLSLRKLDFIGINLTVPHKIAAFAQIDKVDESATRCGAVNTIKINTANSAVATAQDDQKLIGFNTDGEGFLRATRRNRSHRERHPARNESQRSFSCSGPLAGAASHDLRLRVWALENGFASRRRASRCAWREWDIDAVASGHAFIFDLVQSRCAGRSDARSALVGRLYQQPWRFTETPYDSSTG